MDHSETIGALARVTDEGLFERLATAVLRQAEPGLYANLSHPGMNPAGKTRRSPVDGIGFVISQNPPHMVVAHHTIAAANDLRKKWLNEPAKVKKRGLKPTAPSGDVLKTSLIAGKERERTPNLCVTLALTSNQEPSEDVSRDVQAAANRYGMTIDVWPGSRIAHYLDNTPDGQWLRRQYLGITQERMSAELLGELSQASLEAFTLMPASDSLVERDFDQMLAVRSPLPVAFLVGESGFGKTIACYRFLRKHLDAGGYGLVLSHETLSAWSTLDLALDAELRKLHPSLEPFAGGKARSLCSADKPLIVIVEDVNWSDRPSLLLERLVGWANAESKTVERLNWRVLCPVWPSTLATTSNEARKRLDALSVSVSRFSDAESRHAVKQRARLARLRISDLAANRIAEELGNDPLLIGLYDFGTDRRPLKVIDTFVVNSIQRLCGSATSLTLTDCQESLQVVGRQMLVRRQIDPTWGDVREWLREEPDRLAAMRQLTQHGEVVRLSAVDRVERLRFRHDRVRAWLLAEAIAELMRTDLLPDITIAEPFFADVIGSALAYPDTSTDMAERVGSLNPLALFYALKAFGEPDAEVHHAVLKAIYAWLGTEGAHQRGCRSLRWAALQVLSETESSHVIPISGHFKDETWGFIRARFLNGDVAAGVQLCLRVMPGSTAPWRDREIEHAKNRFGSTLISQLSAMLKQRKLPEGARTGSLRLAGHLGEPALADAVRKSWLNDKRRKHHLREYLWAAAQCGGDDPAKLLRPISAAWAKLSNRPPKRGLSPPRVNLGADYLSWAFSEVLSRHAVRYFVGRARRKDLRFPIMLMLRGVNQPEALAFIARVFAEHSRSGRGFWPLPNDVERQWERRQSELGKPMSDASRQRLLEIWNAPRGDKHFRRAAFRLWAATISGNDLEVLRETHDRHLSDDVLWARVRRGDATAIPAFLNKLAGDDSGYWWQVGRYTWNDDLTNALDEEFQRRGEVVPRQWDSRYRSDWITSELIMRLTAGRAEDLIGKHWDHLRFSHWFIEAALLIATPTTRSLASEAVSECPNPLSMFELAQSHFQPQSNSAPGLSRIEQVEAYVPYLDYLDGFALYGMWETCNRLGWFAFRRLHLDSRLEQTYRDRTILDEAKFFSNLDDGLQRGGVDWADFLIDRYVEQTDRVEDVLTLLEKWLKERMTVQAFDFVAAVLRHLGGRSNLRALSVDGIEPEEDVAQIRRDTFYAVARHSLN